MTSVPQARACAAGPTPGLWPRGLLGVWPSLLLWLALSGCSAGSTAPTAVDPAPTGVVATSLPALAIDVAGAATVTSKDEYLSAAYRLTDSVGGVQQEGVLEIKGRGNSTWNLFPKKPYRLKLVSSAPLLAMPASRHWVLLANYSDKTLTRNESVFELSRMMGMEYTPRARDVELTLNGAYQGIYQLVEHIRIAPARVNIPELEVGDTTASAISGGYLLEVDERRGEDFCFDSRETRMVFCAKSPETLNEPAWSRHRAYLTDYIAKVDDAIFGAHFADPATGYAAYVDVESMINYFLINELVKNVDGNLRLSTFLYKKRDGKLHFGPVWDFDIAIGNVNYDGADRVDGWHVRTAPWFSRLFQDPAFEGRVKARWRQMRADRTVDRMLEHMSTRQRYLGAVQVRNFERWPILGSWVWPNRVVTGTYNGEGIAMRDWLARRRAWMDAELGR